MHGIGGNRSNWRANLPAFAPYFACAAWDARGYGDSDDYEAELTFDDFVADLLRVLDHFGARRAHLVGLSMGGRIAMRCALLHPDRVATLTLLDTHEGFEAFSPQQRQAFVDSRRAPLLAGKEPRDIAEPVARSLVSPNARPEHLQQLIDSIAALHKMSYIKSLQATVEQVTLAISLPSARQRTSSLAARTRSRQSKCTMKCQPNWVALRFLYCQVLATSATSRPPTRSMPPRLPGCCPKPISDKNRRTGPP